jgi:ERCC4-type nuclease
MLLIANNEPSNIIIRVKEIAVSKQEEANVTTVPVGDYVWEEMGICIERKEIGDLLNSIRSGHLETQLLDMEQFDNPRLFIHGQFESVYGKVHSRGWSPTHTVGALCSINERYPGIKVYQFSTLTDTLNAIFVIKEKIEKGDKAEGVLRHSKTMNVTDPNFALFLTVPGFGEKRAKEACEKYGNFQNFIHEYSNGIVPKLQPATIAFMDKVVDKSPKPAAERKTK